MSKLSRREMLWAIGAAGLWIPSACGAGSGARTAARADGGQPRVDAGQQRFAYGAYVDEATPERANAGDVCVGTEDNIEGPYYRDGAPWTDDLASGFRGTKLTLRGKVSGADCRPLENVVLDFWQADGAGHYDNDGSRAERADRFDLRGRLKTDASGAFALKTIVPGRYLLSQKAYRPAHIHVKVAAKGHRTLTTQLYFPDDPWNDDDPFIKSSLIMKIEKDGGALLGDFDFVLAAKT